MYNVLWAIYGAMDSNGGGYNTVTSVLANLLATGNPVIPINNQTFGPDPAVGYIKAFVALVSVNGGLPILLAGGEGATLTLNP